MPTLVFLFLVYILLWVLHNQQHIHTPACSEVGWIVIIVSQAGVPVHHCGTGLFTQANDGGLFDLDRYVYLKKGEEPD